ncbi:MAG: ABC transporter permease subunit [Burkholderiaceae bacterium]|nr:ABC transporter permease subunit [Burkholderiaceae bacterium]
MRACIKGTPVIIDGGLMLFLPSLRPNRYDLALLPLLAGLAAAIAYGVLQWTAPLTDAVHMLDPLRLPYYLLRTLLRMFAALGCSLLFTFAFALAASRSERLGKLLLPMLDILQSVPVLGFQAVSVAPFIALFPGSMLGAECAAVFAIFSSQAWNMAFSMTQSVRTVPPAWRRIARQRRMNGWQRFWRIELPHGAQPLVANMMVSMSGGWFFLVASEVISVAGRDIRLPGIGAWIAAAVEQRDSAALAWALLAMAAGIVLYNQLLFRPLMAWAGRQLRRPTASPRCRHDAPRGTWLTRWIDQGAWTGSIARTLKSAAAPVPDWFAKTPAGAANRPAPLPAARLPSGAAASVAVLAAAWAAWHCATFIRAECGWPEAGHVAWLGCLTLLRVMVPVALVSLFWIPFAIWAGQRPRVAALVQDAAQGLAALPLNLLFPVAAALLLKYHLNPDIWLSVLLVAGTQWYILFNVLAGAAALPAPTGLHGWRGWRQTDLSSVFPHCVTGALTACGGAWNASVVAETINWGDTTLSAQGLGSYIRQMTEAGDMPRLALGIAVMCAFVVLLNHTLWRALYRLAERRPAQPPTFATGTGTTTD